MLWKLSYPVSKIEFFLKLALPKYQAKSLKTSCEKLHFLLHLQTVRLKFYQKTTPSGCFSLYMSECYIQKNQVKS